MKKYKLLKNSDIIADNNYLAITFNHSYASDKNKYTRAEFIYVDKYKNFHAAAKYIGPIVDESVISVLFEHNPERAHEIMDGGYVDDEKYENLLEQYDFRLEEKLNEYLSKQQKEKLEAATNEELIDSLNYCGYDAYYQKYRDDIIAEIKKRMDKPILDEVNAKIQKLRGCSCSCSDGIIDDVENIINKCRTETTPQKKKMEKINNEILSKIRELPPT